MTPTGLALLKSDEGFRAKFYRDTNGNGSIGYGRCDPGVKPGMVCTEAEATAWLLAKLATNEHALDIGDAWWRKLDACRADALESLCYNRGVTGAREFTHFWLAMRQGKYLAASQELLSTEPWAREIGARAQRLAGMFRTGLYPAGYGLVAA